MLGIGNESLGKYYVNLFLLLPLRIKRTFPKGHYEHIAAQIHAGLEKYKKNNAKVAKDGTVEIIKGHLYGSRPRVPYKQAQPWEVATSLEIRSNLGLVMDLFLRNDSNIFTIQKLGSIRVEEFIAIALCELIDHNTVEEAILPSTFLAGLTDSTLRRSSTDSTKLKAAYLLKIASQKEEINKLKEVANREAKRLRKTDEDVINRVKAQAVELYSNHRTWSHTKLAEEIKKGDTNGDLPGTSQIRALIKTHCPEIPKQTAGRRPKSKNN